MQVGDLAHTNKKQINLAGPRYTPTVNPGAPNLQIDSLVEVLDALAYADGLGERLRKLRKEVADGLLRTPEPVTRAFKGRRCTPQRLVDLLRLLEQARPDQAEDGVRTLTRATNYVAHRLDRVVGSLMDKQRRHEGDKEVQSRLVVSEISASLRLSEAVRRVQTFVKSPSCAALTTNSLLLLGEWGTGKTHFLCDLTQHRMRKELPTLLVLAQGLPARDDPLEAICEATAVAENGEVLLSGLQALGAEVGGRSLLLIDGINEGDRSVWREALPTLARRLGEYPNVGLVLSCRRPFEKHILSTAASKLLVEVEHPGFEEIEFDAQVEFFDYYNIPTPQVPLILPEFSRPLFLKLLCGAIKGLSTRHKSKRLRDIASGQRGMSHVLEHFVKKIGRPIEDDFCLSRSACWKILKGDRTSSGDEVGVATIMADQLRDYVTAEECQHVIVVLTGLEGSRAKELARRMTVDGLLAEGPRWDEGQVDVIQFPYQRFADHLIARHLLEAHLDIENGTTIRRSFYANRPLGRFFELSPGGYRFAWPGPGWSDHARVPRACEASTAGGGAGACILSAEEEALHWGAQGCLFGRTPLAQYRVLHNSN